MNELRSAALILPGRKGDIPRVLIFDDHNDAFDAMKAYGQEDIQAWMVTFEHYTQGQKPDDLPMQQAKMF